MPMPESITMTMRELDRFKVIQAVVEQGLPIWRAAEKLGLSRRQIERLALRYRKDGPCGLGSRKRGCSSNRQLPPGLESRVRGLIRDSYADFGPTLAAEKLRERNGTRIGDADGPSDHDRRRLGAVYSLADIPLAHARLESSGNGLQGKIAIAVGPLAQLDMERALCE